MKALPLSNRKFLTAWLFCWAIWILFHARVIFNLGYNWKVAFTDSMASNPLLALMSLAVGNNLRYYRPGKTRYVYLLVWCITITGVWLVSSIWLLKLFVSDNTVYLPFIEKSVYIRFAIGLLITGCIAMLSWMWYNQQDQQEYERRKSEAIKLSRDAELYKLRQQLNPHFLFNSLNSISALAGSDAGKARHMIQQLADFLRGSIRKDEQQSIKLEEELKYLKLYLEIEKVRFGHRLNDALEIQVDTNNCFLPSLILQPVVENAIKFGLYDTLDEVTINISAIYEGKDLVSIITNPFDPATSSAVRGTGFGLDSIRRRLYLLYGVPGLLTTAQEGNVFITKLKIPQYDKSNPD